MITAPPSDSVTEGGSGTHRSSHISAAIISCGKFWHEKISSPMGTV